MEFKIAVLGGDGIGPEVTAEAGRVLEAIGRKRGHTFHFSEAPVGGNAIDRYGTALPENTVRLAKQSDAVLFGAVGGPKWDDPRAKVRPEDGILGIRKALGLFANLRPVKVVPQLMEASPLKQSLLQGVDIVVVRELTGGLYFAKPKKRWETARGRRAVDTLRYTEQEVRRVMRVGFTLAQGRKNRVTSVDKANVLKTSLFWRERFVEMAKTRLYIQTESIYVDAMSQYLIRCPSQYDVVVTDNLFGDILTDEASEIIGSLGLGPGANLNPQNKTGMFEPLHGSAPEIAGKDVANPIGMILSVKLMLEFLGYPEAGQSVDRAVQRVLEQGYRTADITGKTSRKIGTRQMGERIRNAVETI